MICAIRCKFWQGHMQLGASKEMYVWEFLRQQLFYLFPSARKRKVVFHGKLVTPNETANPLNS